MHASHGPHSLTVDVVVEVLLAQLVVFAVGTDRRQRLVELLLELGVLLAYRDADALTDHTLLVGVAAMVKTATELVVGPGGLLEEAAVGHQRVGPRRVDATGRSR